MSSTWNYPYNAYRGFITGATQGPAYRQRNVFLYPPQTPQACASRDDLVTGEGECGVNGNSRIFFADQTARVGIDSDGSISGPYLDVFETYTELIGQDNALLYQVYLFGELFQSQLTTLSTDANTGQSRRTRSAQSFQGGLPTSVSFFRERKVSREEFYQTLRDTLEEYNILPSDTCAWMDGATGGIVETMYEPGFDGCMEHLETSFECFYDC